MHSPTLDLTGFDRAIASTRAVLTTVRPEDLRTATPCASWDVGALIDHLIGAARWAADTVEGRTPAAEKPHAAGEHLAAYDAATRAARTAFATVPGDVALTGGLPASALLTMSTQDQFTHGWDLAMALGHSTDLDPQLAAELLVRARAWVGDSYRGPDGAGLFGPETRAPESATAADRLAAFLGRAM